MKGNLLLVDDEVELLKTLKALLVDLADEIYLAYNGKEGLQILKEKTVHCIVSDINMPVMNGPDFIVEVRKMTKKTPFIFYTAHGNEELLNQMLQHGIFDFLNKPHFERLEEAVGRGLKVGVEGKYDVDNKETIKDSDLEDLKKMFE